MAMTQAKIEVELRTAADKRDREIIKQVGVKATAEAAIAEAQRQYGVALEVLLKAAAVPDTEAPEPGDTSFLPEA